MIQIYQTIYQIFKREFLYKSLEYKAGFIACLQLLKIGIQREGKINLQLEILSLKKENEKLMKKIENQKK